MDRGCAHGPGRLVVSGLFGSLKKECFEKICLIRKRHCANTYNNMNRNIIIEQ